MVGTHRDSIFNVCLLLPGVAVCAMLLCGKNAFSQGEVDELEIKDSAEVKAVEDASEGGLEGSDERPAPKDSANDTVENAPWIAPVKKMDPCYELPEVAKLKAMASVLRNQKFMTSRVPTDLLMRCNETSVDLTISQDTRERKVKTSNFSSKSEEATKAIDVYGMGGGVSWRYGFQLEKATTKLKASLNADGAAQVPETASVDTHALGLESALRIQNISVGAFLLYTTEKTKRTFSVAGSDVTISGDQIGLLQPGLAFNWKVKNTEVLLGRMQGAEETKKSETFRLPWTNYLRVIRLLEQDQGLRVQIERSGTTANDSTEFNKGLIAYFLSVDNATVDIAWFGRSSFYKSSVDATGDQLAAFGFVASLICQFADYAEFYVSLHSVNANDTLGGTDNRSAHENIFGAQLGSQYVF
jgi:hypothetical protein